VTEDDLARHFEVVGPVKHTKVLKDRETNRSRGSGFVEMTNEEDAKTAISLLSGKDLMGRAIFVEEARPMAPKPQNRSYSQPRYEEQQYEQPRMTMHDPQMGGWMDVSSDRSRKNRKFDKRRNNRYED